MADIPEMKNMFDDGEEDEIENFDDWVWKHFPLIYSLFKHRIPDLLRGIKWAFQRLFRKHGCADIDLWNLHSHLAKIILPKLIAFRKQNLNGHPMDFCDWEAEYGEYGGLGETKEEYDQAKKEGKYVGGGHDAWLKTLDEMIFAFEYFLYADAFDKTQKAFFKKYGYADPYRKTDDNLTWDYRYKGKDGTMCSTSEPNLNSKEGYEDYVLVGKYRTYIDFELTKTIGERARKGFELFGKYFPNLWD